MKVFSQKRRARTVRRNRRNFYRAVFIFVGLLFANLTWDTLIDPPKTITPIVFGSIVPLVYAGFYLLAKRISYKYKIKLQPFLTIPIIHVSLGTIWFLIVSALIGVGNFSLPTSTKTSTKFSANSATNFRGGSLYTDYSPLKKDNIKSFFLYNENLSKISRLPLYIIKQKCKKNTLSAKTCETFKDSKLNLGLTFISLFFSQMIIIYLSEKIIYPLLRNRINPSLEGRAPVSIQKL